MDNFSGPYGWDRRMHSDRRAHQLTVNEDRRKTRRRDTDRSIIIDNYRERLRCLRTQLDDCKAAIRGIEWKCLKGTLVALTIAAGIFAGLPSQPAPLQAALNDWGIGELALLIGQFQIQLARFVMALPLLMYPGFLFAISGTYRKRYRASEKTDCSILVIEAKLHYYLGDSPERELFELHQARKSIPGWEGLLIKTEDLLSKSSAWASGVILGGLADVLSIYHSHAWLAQQFDGPEHNAVMAAYTVGLVLIHLLIFNNVILGPLTASFDRKWLVEKYIPLRIRGKLGDDDNDPNDQSRYRIN